MSIRIIWGDDSFKFSCKDDFEDESAYEDEQVMSDCTFDEGTTMDEVLRVVDDALGGILSLTPNCDVIDDVSGLHVLSSDEVEDGKTYRIIEHQADDSE